MLCNPLLRQFPLRKEFSRLHGISAVCNLAVFGGGVVLVILFVECLLPGSNSEQ